MARVLEIPEEFKQVGEAMQAALTALTLQVERGRRGSGCYADFEAKATEAAAAVERAMHGVALAALDVDAPRILIDQVEHVRVGRSSANYMTLAGEIAVERSLYRPAGRRSGAAVNLVSLRSGAIEECWLPATARAMAHLLQQGTSREAETTARELRTLPYSRSSFERMGHAVGERYVAKQKDVDERLIEAFEVPADAASVSVALDRVAVPMEEPRPRPPGRPRKGAPKRPVEVVYRMAYCGTVTLHDANGEALHTIRYGSMPHKNPVELLAGMAGDVLALREKRPELKLSLLSDGAPEMRNLLDGEFDAATFGEVLRLIDFWHLVEKLHAAAEVIAPAGKHGELAARWRLMLLNKSTATKGILKELTSSGREFVRVGQSQPVHEAITYLENNLDRTDYAAARRQNLPIGSGNVEATCKTLVGVRMKRAGARWKADTGDHILRLRALSTSDRWEEAMVLTLRAPAVATSRSACSA